MDRAQMLLDVRRALGIPGPVVTARADAPTAEPPAPAPVAEPPAPAEPVEVAVVQAPLHEYQLTVHRDANGVMTGATISPIRRVPL
jgi:hypothetical protein